MGWKHEKKGNMEEGKIKKDGEEKGKNWKERRGK